MCSICNAIRNRIACINPDTAPYAEELRQITLSAYGQHRLRTLGQGIASELSSPHLAVQIFAIGLADVLFDLNVHPYEEFLQWFQGPRRALGIRTYALKQRVTLVSHELT
jgi:hypothetical protein